jgi:N-acetylglucosamine-6-phosphate deacetylase
VRIVDGRIADLGPAPSNAKPIAGYLSPGFVDLQVNGGGGLMVNDTPTRAGMHTIAAAHRQFGTVAIMPTVITDAPDVLDKAAAAAIEAHGDAGIIGLHIEGPHIATARRGTHDPDSVRLMDDRTMDVVAKLRSTNIAVMITLAPEATTHDQIAKLATMGAVVSLGHTDTTSEKAEAAIAAGASCATHLFNAMSPMNSRAPGVVGAIMGAEIYAGIICDGHHVDDRMISLALRGRPVPDRVFLVSDAMATVGGPDQFDLYGQPVRLIDGRLINSEGSLAGAHVTQAQGLKRLIDHIGISAERALRMVTSIPAAAIGCPELASLRGRPVADILVLDDALNVAGTLAEIEPIGPKLDAAE